MPSDDVTYLTVMFVGLCMALSSRAEIGVMCSPFCHVFICTCVRVIYSGCRHESMSKSDGFSSCTADGYTHARSNRHLQPPSGRYINTISISITTLCNLDMRLRGCAIGLTGLACTWRIYCIRMLEIDRKVQPLHRTRRPWHTPLVPYLITLSLFFSLETQARSSRK